MGNLSIEGVISFTLFEVFFFIQVFLANVQVLTFLLCNIVSLSVSVLFFPPQLGLRNWSFLSSLGPFCSSRQILDTESMFNEFLLNGCILLQAIHADIEEDRQTSADFL